MIEDQLIELIEAPFAQVGLKFQGGEEFRDPPLDILRYYRRLVRVGRTPVLGRAQSVVLLARQPVDIEGTRPSYERFLTRMAMAVNGRFPPWRGLSIGLYSLILTPEPIVPGDDEMLRAMLALKLRRMRVVPLGLFRVNLGQEALALAMQSDPSGAFTEGGILAELLCERFRRFVPLIEV
jgi:hypothetical protein